MKTTPLIAALLLALVSPAFAGAHHYERALEYLQQAQAEISVAGHTPSRQEAARLIAEAIEQVEAGRDYVLARQAAKEAR